MVGVFLIEVLKGSAKAFLNMITYWAFLLVLLAGYGRIQKERLNFGFKVFDYFSEWRGTWTVSILAGGLITVFTLGIGTVFSYDSLLLLSIVVILLSITYNFSFLSASYTIGITYLLLLLLPIILEYTPVANYNYFNNTNFTGLVFLLGLFLIVESILLRRTTRNETFPNLTYSNRGALIGSHTLAKMTVIPFFVLIPSGMITPLFPFWPYFTIGGESFSLLLVPFIVGFNYKVTSNIASEVAKKLSKAVFLLSIGVILLAVASIYFPPLSIVAVIFAILGREFINYKQRLNEQQSRPYFVQVDKGLKILGIIPNSPAARLNLLVGETIVRVNGESVHCVDEFYELLQSSGAFFKLDVIDDAGEIRFVQSAFYENDHHELGIVFITDRYIKKLKEAR